MDSLKKESENKMSRGSIQIPFLAIAWALALTLANIPLIAAQSNDQLPIGIFSNSQPGDKFPAEWKPLTFEKIPTHTRYTLVKDEEQVVVKAVSRESSSGLTREMTIDPKEYPVVQWRWKIENILQNGDVTKKEGDDYPARLYITFEYDSAKVGFFEKAQYETAKLLYGQYPPIGALNYIWASKSPVGTMTLNPYTDQVTMIVIESGETKLNEWVTEERNVYNDYMKAFEEDPPNISGVAIMTDTDNTEEHAVAYFGDIVFKRSVKSQE